MSEQDSMINEPADSEKFPIALPSFEELIEQYDGKFIAIYDDKIYAISDNPEEIHLLAKQRIKMDEGTFFVIRYVQKGVFIYGI